MREVHRFWPALTTEAWLPQVGASVDRVILDRFGTLTLTLERPGMTYRNVIPSDDGLTWSAGTLRLPGETLARVESVPAGVRLHWESGDWWEITTPVEA